MEERKPNISASINVTMVDKARLVDGKKVLENGKAAKYLDMTLIPTPNNEYGHSYMIVQTVPKEERDNGTVAPILGNCKTWDDLARPVHGVAQVKTAQVGEDDVPF